MAGDGCGVLPTAAWGVLPFLHPGLALAAVGAAAIPVVVHLINRRRHRRVPWAAMGFLLAANARSLRRIRLEHWLLLGTRIAAVLLFGLAVARPLLSGTALLGVGDTYWHHVLLVDNSLSASVAGAAGSGAIPAVDAAATVLSGIPRGDAVSVIALSAPARPIVGQAAFDRRSVRARLAAVESTESATDLAGGLARALEVLEASSAAPENRAVYVVSDQTTTAWTGADETAALARRIAEEARLVVVPLAEQPRGNVAVTALACPDSLPGTRRPIRLVSRVTNYSEDRLGGLMLQVRRGDRIVREVPVDPVGPAGKVDVAFSVVVDAAGTAVIEARLERSAGDALPIDDVRRLSLEAHQAVPVLLVDGRPGATRFEGEAGYLAAALAPTNSPGEPSLLAPTVVSELELPSEPLGGYRVVALCNASLAGGRAADGGGVWRRLEEYVRGGGGLLVFCGDAVSPEDYNRLGYSGGEGLLPGRLGRPEGDDQSREQYVRLELAAPNHPAVAAFADAAESGLFLKGSVYRFLPLEPDPAAATVLIRYSNGRPALVERSFGAGRVCVLTTTANMNWNNLAARGDYVSLMWGLVCHLAGDTREVRNRLVGQMVADPLLPMEGGAARQEGRFLAGRVTTPDGSVEEAWLETAGERYELNYGPLDRAGVYTAVAGARRTAYVANIDPAESDLRSLDEQSLRKLLGRPLLWASDPQALRRGLDSAGAEEFSRSLLFLVLVLLVGERWLAMRFATRR